MNIKKSNWSVSVQLGAPRWEIHSLIPAANKFWIGSQKTIFLALFLKWHTKCRAHPLGHSLELTPLHSSAARASLLAITYICLFKQSLLSPANSTLCLCTSHPFIRRENCISLHPESHSNITVWGICKCKWIQEGVNFCFREIYSLLNPQTSLFRAMYLNFFLFPDMHIPHWSCLHKRAATTMLLTGSSRTPHLKACSQAQDFPPL